MVRMLVYQLIVNYNERIVIPATVCFTFFKFLIKLLIYLDQNEHAFSWLLIDWLVIFLSWTYRSLEFQVNGLIGVHVKLLWVLPGFLELGHKLNLLLAHCFCSISFMWLKSNFKLFRWLNDHFSWKTG